MSELKKYKCPACSAYLTYTPGTEEIQCEHCGTVVPISVLNIIDESEEKKEFNWGDYKKNLSNEHFDNKTTFSCSSCGAQIETEETTSSLICPYCDNVLVVSDRIEGGLKPNKIIPFKITKDKIPGLFKEFYKDKKLLPKAFFNDGQLSKATGVYVPFWLYSCKIEGKVNLSSEIVTHYSDSSYYYTKHSRYLLAREGEMEFDCIPVDASLKMDNDLMDSLEPFDLSEMVDFNDAYLAGFISDRFDSDPDNELPRANSRMINSANDLFAANETQYSSVSIKDNAMKITKAGVKYVFLPVYLLHYTYKGKKYRFAVNGQTGKIIGDIPISKTKVFLYFLKAFGIAAAVASVIQLLFQLFMGD